MGKISKTLLNSLLLSTTIATENQDTDEQPPYSVIGCNDELTPVSCVHPMESSLPCDPSDMANMRWIISYGPYRLVHQMN